MIVGAGVLPCGTVVYVRAYVVAGVLILGGCRERNPAFMPELAMSTGEGSTSLATSEESSSGFATTAGTTMPATTTTSVGESSGAGSTGDASTSDASSGGEPVPYADCNGGAACPRGWDECIALDNPAIAWCSHYCDQPDDCETPLTGDAEVVCAGPSGHDCALDCSNDQTCPDGMACIEIIHNVVRCVWAA